MKDYGLAIPVTMKGVKHQLQQAEKRLALLKTLQRCDWAPRVKTNYGIWINECRRCKVSTANLPLYRDSVCSVRRAKPATQIFEVVHQCFATDHLEYTTTLVHATSRQAAVDKFNGLAKHRTEYPYCWSQVELKDVTLSKPI